jgi:molybdopterin molybdotransferase
VQKVLGEAGLTVDFWKIAMKPGKPMMFGRLGATNVLGLPGNPVSSMVCALLFLGPAIDAMLGLPGPGVPLATPFPVQDSSMMSRLAEADCLVIRPPNAPPARKGDVVEIIALADIPGA